jgi:hypothetical protein
MKLTCICCGKRWNAQHVFRDKPEDFNRQGASLRACPSCHGIEPDGMTDNERLRLQAIAAIGEHLGDELDRLAASNADLNKVTLRFDGDLSKLAECLQRAATKLADAKGLRLRLEGLDASPRKD